MRDSALACLKRPLAIITLLDIFILFSSWLWMGLDPLPPSLIYEVVSAAGLLLVLLFFINVGCALFKSQYRRLHLAFAFAILASAGLIILCGRLIGDKQLQWFLRGGEHEYDSMIDRIRRTPSALNSTNRLLNDMAGLNYRFRIYGMTNADGTTSITFFGRGNSWRRGYFYYSGDNMVASVSDTNMFYFQENPNRRYLHVTNHWYEF